MPCDGKAESRAAELTASRLVDAMEAMVSGVMLLQKVHETRLNVRPCFTRIEPNTRTQKRRHVKEVVTILQFRFDITHKITPTDKIFPNMTPIRLPASNNLMRINIRHPQGIVHVKQIADLLAPIDSIELRPQQFRQVESRNLTCAGKPAVFHAKRECANTQFRMMLNAVNLDFQPQSHGK